MSELEIPEAAYEAAEQVSKTYVADVDALDAASDAINAAAPLIVAADLRNAADELEKDLKSKIAVSASARKVIVAWLDARADGYDPKGITR